MSKVQFASVTEGMFGVRWFAAIVNTEQYQCAVAVSTSEWIASDSMAELPEKAAAKNFVLAIARFPSIAATTAVFDSSATLEV